MEKRYQVFISSTFQDLKEERTAVYQTVMEMDCFPAGMELFPAIDDEQFDFIKRIIDDSDYYILIIGGRYGSIAPEGISYTEKEYDYAIEKGIKVIALIHGNPEDLSVANSDTDPELVEKLEKFRAKVSKNRMVKFWTSLGELQGVVATSLNKTMRTYPAVGWTRANTTSSVELLSEVNDLRKENDHLSDWIDHLQNQLEIFYDENTDDNPIEDYASLEDEYIFVVHYTINQATEHIVSKGFRKTWGELFKVCSRLINENNSETFILNSLTDECFPNEELEGGYEYSILSKESSFQIRTQFMALQLIEIVHNDIGGPTWKLTELGQIVMFNTWVVKKDLSD